MAASKQESGGGARVLVVDDNAVSLRLLEHSVKRLGHEAVVAASGLEALIALDRRPVDLVLLDIVMSEMDGRAVLARIKSDSRFAALPVVMVSGLETQDVVTQCLEAGAADYLFKPVNFDDLKSALDEWLPGTTPRGDARGGDARRPGAAAPRSGPETETVLDRHRFGELLADYGPETTDSIVSRFSGRAASLIENINQASADEDGEAWRRAAHDLKGGARLLGLARLAACCRRIEIACGDNRLEEAQAATADLGAEVAKALSALAEHRRDP